MSRYILDDNTVVDTDKAKNAWDEDTYFDGNNRVGKVTGSQWEDQTLYKSRKGRYYIEYTSRWQGSRGRVEWASREEATRWLLVNDHDLPEDLEELEYAIVE